MIDSLPRTEPTATVLPDLNRTNLTLSRNMAVALAAIDKVFEEYPERIRFYGGESRNGDA